MDIHAYRHQKTRALIPSLSQRTLNYSRRQEQSHGQRSSTSPAPWCLLQQHQRPIGSPLGLCLGPSRSRPTRLACPINCRCITAQTICRPPALGVVQLNIPVSRLCRAVPDFSCCVLEVQHYLDLRQAGQPALYVIIRNCGGYPHAFHAEFELPCQHRQALNVQVTTYRDKCTHMPGHKLHHWYQQNKQLRHPSPMEMLTDDGLGKGTEIGYTKRFYAPSYAVCRSSLAGTS